MTQPPARRRPVPMRFWLRLATGIACVAVYDSAFPHFAYTGWGWVVGAVVGFLGNAAANAMVKNYRRDQADIERERRMRGGR